MFQKEFWTSSAKKLSQTKYLALMAVFIAMKVAFKSLYIPITPTLRIYFGFFIVAIEASIMGPVAMLVSGFVTDIVGFMLFPSGQFFFGYTLSEMLGHFIFGLFLYNQPITILKLFISRAIINIFINVGLGSLWNSILMGKAYMYYAAKSIVKNLTLLPIEVIILVLLFNALLPYLMRRNLVYNKTKVPLAWK